MADLPRDKAPDSTLALLADGYRFISKRCQRYRSDAFATRLMLRQAVGMRGEEAVRLLYDGDRFTRVGAMPPTTLRLLQDKGSVQQLDGPAHHHREQMFMSLMTPAGIRRLVDAMADRWRARIGTWATMDRVVLHDEVEGILCRAVCAWAGVPLAEAEAEQRTREIGAMIDGAGAVGPRNWRGLLLRARTERWLRGIVDQVQTGALAVDEASAAHVIATHRDLEGMLLDTEVAAVELLNVLRPTVAVARFVTFAALALHNHPECRQPLEAGGDDELELFVQEVHRFYPFFPFVGGRALAPFAWQGHRFASGTWVIVDLYGTDHDARIWADPEAFQSERFRRWDGSAFNFVPQGGGDHETSHRCAGEWMTIALMKEAVRLLTTAMRYDVPEQDLRLDLSRMPAIPRSRFVLANVRPIPDQPT